MVFFLLLLAENKVLNTICVPLLFSAFFFAVNRAKTYIEFVDMVLYRETPWYTSQALKAL